MFPLGSVLLPGGYLPLHVFEDRYRELVEDCLDGAGEFGVVLIERGSEVGGGDRRAAVGTVARIVEATRFDDGRWALGTVGTRRIRVVQWLADAPYPRAEIEGWGEPSAGADLVGAVEQLIPLLRRVLAAGAELGDVVAPATVTLNDDPVRASYEAVALAPLGPADQYALLAASGAHARIEALAALLVDEEAHLARRLALESSPGDLGDPSDPPASS